MVVGVCIRVCIEYLYLQGGGQAYVKIVWLNTRLSICIQY
jgi:hypothetical protein